MKKYIVVDIDGTICESRHHTSLEQFMQQDFSAIEPRTELIKLLVPLVQDYSILFLTARSLVLIDQTTSWVGKYCKDLYFGKGIPHFYLRPVGNLLGSGEFKLDALRKLDIPPEQVLFVIDDSVEVLETLRENNYPVIDALNSLPQISKEIAAFVERDKPQFTIKVADMPKGTTEIVGFKKYDSDKVDFSIIPTLLLEAYATIGHYGAHIKGYGKFNYKKAKLEDIPRYHAAFLRHYFGYTDKKGAHHGFLKGVIDDAESGHKELWHALWNIVALIEACEQFGYETISNELRGLNGK